MKKTSHFRITKINWLSLFKQIISVYSENHTKPTNTKWRFIDCWNRWDIQLPLGFKGLLIYSIHYEGQYDKTVIIMH
jgi:hypothetical protein